MCIFFLDQDNDHFFGIIESKLGFEEKKDTIKGWYVDSSWKNKQKSVSFVLLGIYTNLD